MATSHYASSSSVTVRLSPDGKNWKDWIKQVSNYAASENAFSVLDGAACPTFDHLDERYTLQSLMKANVQPTTMTAAQILTEIENAGKVNKHLKPYNDEVRRVKKEDEDRFNLWVSRDAKLQNTILSSIDKTLAPQVRGCTTAKAMYHVLKDLNNTSDFANAASAWHTFTNLRADTCKSVRDYIGKFREALTELTAQGIVIGWRKPSSASTSAEAGVDELMTIHLLQGLAHVLPAWVEARNNDLRAGHGTWTIDILIQSVEDHIRHVNEEPVKTFLTISKQQEEQRALARLNGQRALTASFAATPSMLLSAPAPAPSTSTYKGRNPKPIGMCNHCKREHTGPNELCWFAHPELMPERRKRTAWQGSPTTNTPAARTNITTADEQRHRERNTDANADEQDNTYSHHIFTTIASSTISPSILQKAVRDATYKQRYCYDTAANRHVFNDRSKFISLIETANNNNNVHGSTGTTTAAGVGTVRLRVVKSDGNTEVLHLTNVLYCPDFATNVISQAPFKRKGSWYHSGKDRLYTAATDDELAYLPEIDGIPNFLVITAKSQAPAALCYASLHAYRSSSDEPSATRSADDWHHIYGHANLDILKRTAAAVKGMTLSTNKLRSDCAPCGLSKSKQIISRKPQDVPTTLLGMVHVDIVGPITTVGVNGERYWMLITGGKTGQQWIYTSDSRATLGVNLIDWCKQMKARGLTVIVIRTDNARELLSERNSIYFTNEGITVEASPPYEPTRNGRAERANGITEDRTRAALIAAGLPKSFWPYAAKYIIRLRNLSVTSAPDGNITPQEAWNRALNYPNPIPNVAKMHAFGHTGYVHIPAAKRIKGDKFEPRAAYGHLVSMVGESIYQMWLPEEDKVVTTSSVKWDSYDKAPSAAKTMHTTPPPSNPLTGRFQPLVDCMKQGLHPHPGGEDEAEDLILPEAGNAQDNFNGFEQHEDHAPPPEIDQAPTRGHNVAERRCEINADLNPAHIIDGPRERRPRVLFTSPTFTYCFAMALVKPTTKLADMAPEPRNFKQFLQHARRDNLQLAMEDEYTALIANNTWRPATAEEITQHEVIPAQWVWTYKGDAEGNHVKDKARMVACGNRQKESIWYREVYSYVVRTATLRALLALVAYYDLECEQLDVITAYLNASLTDDDIVLLRLPPGCPAAKQIVRLQRGMYGLKQSALLWYNDLKASLKDLGFEPIEADPCVFVNSVTFGIIVVYVDDIILITKDTSAMATLKQRLFACYKARDLGPISFYLGIRVRRDRTKGTLSLSMDSYIERVVDEYHMADSPAADTPLPVSSLKLTKREDQADNNLIHQYQSLVAKLLYPTAIIRPDLAWHVNFMARFATNPSDEQLSLLKRILRYYKGTANLGITYHRRAADDDAKDYIGLVGYSDSAFGDNLDRKSSAGYVFKMAGGVISYKSYRQRLVTLSSTESEYIALTYAAKEAAWLRRLLRQVGYTGRDVLPLQLYTDNLSAYNMVRKDGLHERTKHIDNYYKYTKHEYKKGNILLNHMPGIDMPADGLTKPLDKLKHTKFVRLLDMVPVPGV
jgi:hypothetical protein